MRERDAADPTNRWRSLARSGPFGDLRCQASIGRYTQLAILAMPALDVLATVVALALTMA